MLGSAVGKGTGRRVNTVIAVMCSFAAAACGPKHAGTDVFAHREIRAPSVFSRVVQTLVDSSRVMIAQLLTSEEAQRPDLRIAVDPRLLQSPVNYAPESVIALVEAPGFEEGQEDDISARLSELARLGIDTLSLLRYQTCPSVGAVSAPEKPLDRSGCPASLTVLAGVGRTNDHAKRDTVPIVVYIGDARGLNALFTSFVLERTAEGWRLVGRTPSVIIE